MAENEELLTVRVPSDLYRHAKQIAAGRDETLSQVVRRALRAYVASGPAQMDLEQAIAASPGKRKPAKRPTKRR